ncbi:hypothetical protein DAMA08_016090 [Martiniozyma asiatica (nom. inval.)]|nr:hypothetical protein DAMA08_016090 [Martiniozyma asiatica]
MDNSSSTPWASERTFEFDHTLWGNNNLPQSQQSTPFHNDSTPLPPSTAGSVGLRSSRFFPSPMNDSRVFEEFESQNSPFLGQNGRIGNYAQETGRSNSMSFLNNSFTGNGNGNGNNSMQTPGSHQLNQNSEYFDLKFNYSPLPPSASDSLRNRPPLFTPLSTQSSFLLDEELPDFKFSDLKMESPSPSPTSSPFLKSQSHHYSAEQYAQRFQGSLSGSIPKLSLNSYNSRASLPTSSNFSRPTIASRSNSSGIGHPATSIPFKPMTPATNIQRSNNKLKNESSGTLKSTIKRSSSFSSPLPPQSSSSTSSLTLSTSVPESVPAPQLSSSRSIVNSNIIPISSPSTEFITSSPIKKQTFKNITLAKQKLKTEPTIKNFLNIESDSENKLKLKNDKNLTVEQIPEEIILEVEKTEPEQYLQLEGKPQCTFAYDSAEISPSSSAFPSPTLPHIEINTVNKNKDIELGNNKDKNPFNSSETEIRTRVMHYIHYIITRHNPNLHNFVVSVPSQTSILTILEILRGVFSSIGKIREIVGSGIHFKDGKLLKMNNDKFEKSADSSIANNNNNNNNNNDLFTKYKVIAEIAESGLSSTIVGSNGANHNHGPWKSVKFLLNGKEVKMMIFTEKSQQEEEVEQKQRQRENENENENKENETNSNNTELFTSDEIELNDIDSVFPIPPITSFTGFSGSSKLDVCWYPEGFSSTFHRRGVNNFMFVRELQSKMIVNRQRVPGGPLVELGEFRISVPVEEMGMEDACEEGERLKRSFVVNIDLKELDGKNNGFGNHTVHPGKFSKKKGRGAFRGRGGSNRARGGRKA